MSIRITRVPPVHAVANNMRNYNSPEEIQKRARWDRLREETRPFIIELNRVGNQVFPSGDLAWRHFVPLNLAGQFEIYGTMTFKQWYIEEMREQILRAFPQLKVSKTRSSGQNMYGFCIDFSSNTDSDVKTYMASMPKIITQVKKDPRCALL